MRCTHELAVRHGTTTDRPVGQTTAVHSLLWRLTTCQSYAHMETGKFMDAFSHQKSAHLGCLPKPVTIKDGTSKGIREVL